MTRFLSTPFVAAMLLAGITTASAQDSPSHESHHPAGTTPKATTPAPSSPSGAAPSGGQGAMMMGGGMTRMMIGQGGVGMSDMMMPGMDMASHVEGRIAFLRTELKIGDAQERVWNQFAQALRDNANKLDEVRTAAPAAGAGPSPLDAQLEQQERWYTARLDGLRHIKTTFDHLYSALSLDQQKTADQIMGPHLGLMPMAMGGMSSGGMSMGAAPGKKP